MQMTNDEFRAWVIGVAKALRDTEDGELPPGFWAVIAERAAMGQRGVGPVAAELGKLEVESYR